MDEFNSVFDSESDYSEVEEPGKQMAETQKQ